MQNQNQQQPVSDSQPEYEVQQILDKRVEIDQDNNAIIKYLVHWKGWAIAESTWEPAQYLENARHKVQEFERKRWENSIRKEEKKLSLHTSKPNHLDPVIPKKQQKVNQTRQQKISTFSKSLSKQKSPAQRNMRRFTKLLQKFGNQFEILGAKKSQITFYLKFPNGQIQAIQSKYLEQKSPFKMIQFYEKHIQIQTPTKNKKKAVGIYDHIEEDCKEHVRYQEEQ